jgi:hypothetical protein
MFRLLSILIPIHKIYTLNKINRGKNMKQKYIRGINMVDKHVCQMKYTSLGVLLITLVALLVVPGALADPIQSIVDITPPVTMISGVTENGSYDNSVTVTLNATADPGGSGVKGSFS